MYLIQTEVKKQKNQATTCIFLVSQSQAIGLINQ